MPSIVSQVLVVFKVCFLLLGKTEPLLWCHRKFRCKPSASCKCPEETGASQGCRTGWP